jgi:hypothetical protein
MPSVVTIRIATVLCVALLTAATAGAQAAPPSIFTPDGAAAVINPARDARAPLFALEPETDGADGDGEGAGAGQEPFDWKAERRACEGCPRRSVGRALLQTTLINVLYEAVNLIRGQVTARITPKT